MYPALQRVLILFLSCENQKSFIGEQFFKVSNIKEDLETHDDTYTRTLIS